LLIATGAVLMVKVIKSAVKCYKKKTKKTVGGKRKIYEYNQYLVPLKRSDKFECSEEVFIIPQRQIEELVGEDIALAEEYLKNLGVKDSNIEVYERELAELEWKHNELSKSYKELVSKHTKTNKKLRLEDERLKSLEEDKKKLMNKLEEVSGAYKTLKTNYELESEKNKVLEGELNIQKDKDLWTSLKSRLGSKKDGEGE
jgi:chromosome segregation ATPase